MSQITDYESSPSPISSTIFQTPSSTQEETSSPEETTSPQEPNSPQKPNSPQETTSPNKSSSPNETTSSIEIYPLEESNDSKTILQEIDSQNQNILSISQILSAISNPDEITCLYAGNNRLKDTLCIHNFSQIKELYLNNNQLQTLSEFSTLQQLQILVLSYNKLTEITALSSLKGLTHLDISSNPNFSDYKSILPLTGLTTLNISHTKITNRQYQLLCKELPNCHIIY